MTKIILSSVWPLMFGMLLIMMGHGLQTTLLGLRANAEGFSVSVTGIIMSLYFIGFLFGSIYVPKLITGVGHIRVFMAMASLASVTILLHGIFIDEWLWALVRIVTGFIYAGLYIVTESWLNDATTNKTRGKIFAYYLLIINLGLFSGQYLIQLAPITAIGLFILISVLVSIAVTPIALSKRPAPAFEYAEPLPLKRMFKVSPLAVIGVLSSGFCGGTFFTIGAVFTAEIDFTTSQTANFLASYVLGCALLPTITGWLSDRIGRRIVIIATAFLGAIFVGLGYFASPFGLFAVAFLSGGFIGSLYGLCIAYMNDHLEQKHFVSASAGMILMNAAGASLGPVISTFLMGQFGAQSFFAFLSLTLLIVAVYGLYRSQQTNAIPLEEQADFIPVPISTTAATIIQITTDDDEEDTDHGSNIIFKRGNG